MILVDTSIWIDYFRQVTGPVAETLAEYIERDQVVALSPVFGELLQGVRDQREEKIVLEHWKNLPKIDESNLFVEAGRLSYRHKLYSAGVGLIDCYILAAARVHKLDILSLDKKLLSAHRLLREKK
ncbi:MAG TPA: PIN domain-containing protein [Cyclobacteriaceae bacterium]